MIRRMVTRRELLWNVLSLLCPLACEGAEIHVVDRPDSTQRNEHYVNNGELLAAPSLVKFPTGTIKPEGWLRKQLTLQAEGLCALAHLCLSSHCSKPGLSP